MQPLALIPVPFSSLTRLIATASRYCGRESSLLRPLVANRRLHAGDVVRLALLAPEIRFPIDVNATVVARGFKPPTVKVRYALADLAQMECALGTLYRRSRPELPVLLDVSTFTERRRCRLAGVSPDGATFEVQGEVDLEACRPDSEVRLQLPHPLGRVDVSGKIASITPRAERSRLRVSFTRMAETSRRMLDDIVFRFRLGAAPWTPTLQAPGL